MDQSTYAYALLAQNDQTAAEMRHIVDETDHSQRHDIGAAVLAPGDDRVVVDPELAIARLGDGISGMKACCRR
jgi:hypothetical protein